MVGFRFIFIYYFFGFLLGQVLYFYFFVIFYMCAEKMYLNTRVVDWCLFELKSYNVTLVGFTKT